MHFPHIFLFTSVTSRSSIDIQTLYEPQRHENYKNKIICKQCS